MKFKYNVGDYVKGNNVWQPELHNSIHRISGQIVLNEDTGRWNEYTVEGYEFTIYEVTLDPVDVFTGSLSFEV